MEMKAQPEQDEHAAKTRRNNRIGASAAFLIVAGFTWYILEYSGSDATQEIIALFTIVAGLATALQWMAMVEQNLHMRKQTDTMVEQNDHIAEQTKTMIAQNDAIKSQIDQGEREQRAWLATSGAENPTFIRFNEDDPNSAYNVGYWGIEVRNTGPTPGIITYSHVRHVCRLPGLSLKNDIEVAEHFARRDQPTRTVVAPGSVVTFRLNDIQNSDTIVDSLMYKNIEKGDMIFYIVGAFIYQDVFGIEHKTTCCFRYKGFRLSSSRQDGEMT
jgi:hypothetical protein